MYHIYTTDGLILKRKNFGEGNVLLYVLTKDLGLILASAQSVRSHKSKLSSALMEYSLSTISFIHGKNGWKITNAASRQNFFFDYSPVHRELVAKISNVLIKLIAGEEKHPEIFETVLNAFDLLEGLKDEEVFSLESLIMLRILYHLGYVAKKENTDVFLENNTFNSEILEKISLQKRDVIELINKGLKESQL